MVSRALVLPGGGYRTHAPHEAEPVVAWLSGIGLPADVLRYPLGMPHPAAHSWVSGEIERVREEGADRILLIGFSAGGHAAGLAALRPMREAGRVDGVVLGYPVVSLQSRAHRGSSEVLLGDRDTVESRAALSLELQATVDAPPAFLFHSIDDPKVPVEHSLLLSSALREAGVRHELHVYADGGHGCGLGGASVPWVQACEAWLAREGWIPRGVMLDKGNVSRQSGRTGTETG